METLVQIIMVLVSFSFLLKLTCHKWYQVLLMTTVSALFTGLGWELAIEQSRSQIESWLSDPSLMLDTAVLLTADVFLQIAYVMSAVNMMTSGKVSGKTLLLYRILRWFPGLMFFPVLFSLLVSAIFSLPGVPFPAVSWGLAAAISIALPLMVRVLKLLLPEKELRLELLFLTSVLTGILGIIATVNGRTAAQGTGTVDLTALAAVAGIAAAGWISGYIIYLIRLKKR